VLDPQGREVVFQGALDPHTPVGQDGCAPRTAKLDAELSRPIPPLHTHDGEAAARARRGPSSSHRIWPTCIVVPAGYRVALTVRGKDLRIRRRGGDAFQHEEPDEGCGPFLHDDPDDRPPQLFRS